jgi:alpha-maltose-1-phosphate synthase
MARELAARGFEVSWIASSATAPSDEANVRTVPIRSFNITEKRLGFPFPIPDPRDVGRLVREVRASDVVILHDALYATTVIGLVAARLAKKPVLVVQHIGVVPYSNPILRLMMAIGNRAVARPLLSAADQVVFISGFVQAHFSDLKYRSAPLLIFNGVNSAFRPPATTQEGSIVRRKLQFGDQPIALFVGRFVEKKGLRHLREAAALRRDVQWVFAGWGPIDPAGWGLPNVRTYAGLKDEALADLYRASDVLVLPSKGEGFPLVVQEALACGLPVVCGSELVQADPAAAEWLFPIDVHDPPSTVVACLLKEFDRALQSRRDAADAWLARSAFVRERYAWDRVTDKYAEVVTGLADRSRVRPSPASGSA